MPFIYYGAVQEATHEVKDILEQQYSEVDSALRHHLTPKALNLISALIDNDEDHLFIAAYVEPQGKVLEGNLEDVPEITKPVEKYYVLNHHGDNFLIRYMHYQTGGKLIIGYSLRHVEKIQSIIVSRLVADLLLSLAAAIFCSMLITFFITRKLRQINHTCSTLMQGDLSARAPVTGSNDEFDLLSQNLNRMLSRITELIENIRATSDHMAHDLRTPLNRHRLRLEHLLTLPSTSDESRGKIGEAISELDTLHDLCDTLLIISRAEARVETNRFEKIALASLIADVLDFYLPFADEKNVFIEMDIPDEYIIHADRQLLAQGFANLIDNAIKFAPENSSIMISAAEQEKEIVLEIADQGSGIPPEFTEKVKERFFRLEASRTTPGTGLGLSVVDAILKLHNAQWELIDNRPGLRVKDIFPKKPDYLFTIFASPLRERSEFLRLTASKS